MAVACSSTRTLADAASRSRYRRPRCVSGHQTVNRCRKRRGSIAGRSTPKRVPHALVVDLAVDLQESLRAPVERLELVLPQRPAAVRHPRPPVQRARVEREALARPQGSGPAQEPAAALGQRRRSSPRLALVQALGRGAAPAPAALEHDHLGAAVEELVGDRDAGRAGADHAHVGLKLRSVLQAPEVIYHRAPSPADGPAVRTVRLPGTDLMPSRLGFGTALLMARLGRRESVRLLEIAHDSGITHVDTARAYGYGDAESAVGEFLAGRREGVTVTTKVGLLPPRDSRGLRAAKAVARAAASRAPALRSRLRARAEAMVESGRFDPREARLSLETSLRELRTDAVDILLLHECRPADLETDGLLSFLEDVVREGKVGCFGAGHRPRVDPHHRARAPEFARVAQFSQTGARRATRRRSRAERAPRSSPTRPCEALLGPLSHALRDGRRARALVARAGRRLRPPGGPRPAAAGRRVARPTTPASCCSRRPARTASGRTPRSSTTSFRRSRSAPSRLVREGS